MLRVECHRGAASVPRIVVVDNEHVVVGAAERANVDCRAFDLAVASQATADGLAVGAQHIRVELLRRVERRAGGADVGRVVGCISKRDQQGARRRQVRADPSDLLEQFLLAVPRVADATVEPVTR